MSDGNPITVGETTGDIITKGSTLARDVNWVDENGDPLDLSSAVLSIIDANPPAIASEGTITATDSAGGISELYIPAAVIGSLPTGRIANFRVMAQFSVDSILVSPVIYLEVK